MERREPSVDESLRPQLDRFQTALGTRVTERQVESSSDELKLFTAAFVATVNNYVDRVDPAKLVDGAIAGMDIDPATAKRSDSESLVEAGISGMLSSLDQNSVYLSPEVYQDLQVDKRGRFGGVGLEITIRDGVVTIVSPIEETPAARAGLRPGDQLLAIGDVSTEGLSLVQAVRRLRGPVGTQVLVTVQHAGSSDVLAQPLTREAIRLRSVTFSRVKETYGYIRISQFSERTGTDVEGALRSLQQEGSLDGLVLDLRNDPGGLVSQAVRVADVFLDAGLIVYTEGRAQGQNQKYYARKEGTWCDIPIAILVNGGTAAGSEIVAAALQAHKRSVLVGTRTLGRGTVQTIIPIGEAALRLTTARTYSPTGSSLDSGVQPDLLIDADPAMGFPSVQDPVVAAALRLLSGSDVQ